MAGFGSCFVSFGLLIIAFIAISVNIRAKGRSMNQTQIVQQPLIGGTVKAINHQGPWPECLGLGGEDCRNIIETYASDVTGNVYILPEDSVVTMDFRTNRVRIFVNSEQIVTQIPSRG